MIMDSVELVIGIWSMSVMRWFILRGSSVCRTSMANLLAKLIVERSIQLLLIKMVVSTPVEKDYMVS